MYVSVCTGVAGLKGILAEGEDDGLGVTVLSLGRATGLFCASGLKSPELGLRV